MKMPRSKLLFAAEVLMVIGAVAGSTLLALNIPISKWGYLMFLISSSSGLYVGWKTGVKSILILNGYFTVVNLIGTVRWLF